MALYLKILRFLKPYWKHILVSIFLTFLYIVLNNVSLWVSVDFIRELFEPGTRSALVISPEKQQVDSPEAEEKTDSVSRLYAGGNLYQKINRAIKKIIIRENRYETLKVVCLVIFLSFFLKNLVFYVRRVLMNFIELKVIVNLRNRLYSVLLRLPLSYFEKHRTGELTSIVFNDVSAVNVVLNNSFGKMILTPLQVLTNLVILVLISWKLSILTFTIIPLIGFVIVKIGQSIRRKRRRVFRQIAQVMAVFQEAVSSIRIVKAFANEEREEDRFQDENRRFFRTIFRANRLSYLTSPLNETIAAFILVALLWYGGNLVYSNAGLTAEDFIRYLVFLFTTFQPLKELSGLNNNIQTGLAAAERIFRLMEEAPEVYQKPGAVPMKTFRDSIIFDRVYFRYAPDDPFVLKDINLEIHKGETVAIVGHSGAGKTTLVDLIPRFYDVTEGRILVDGVDVRDYELSSLRRQIGIVTQEPILFNDTVRMNIGYGLDGVSDDAIVEAAKAANAWEFIQAMEDGLDTVIGERGVRLSGGQKQRLSIARAILKNPPILILDEATSALDSESERLVQEAIERLMANRTVLVIAHRLSTIIHAHRIVVLKEGEILDVAPHDILLQRCAYYRKLYELQFLGQETGVGSGFSEK
jgi:subfamily B ATP-binding cassette protein MsbA